MRMQVLSDLHMETEAFEPEPAAGAELLVLAGDIDTTWEGLRRFAGWPVPVLMVAGNHEFDRRDVRQAWNGLRDVAQACGIRLLERETVILEGGDGRRVRFIGTIRWSDFELLGRAGVARCRRAARYFVGVMGARLDGEPFDPDRVRGQALECRAWLADALAARPEGSIDATVVITHYAPSGRSADPRYGLQPGTASFCNNDEALLPLADLWLHGHLHCRQDYRFGRTRVVSNARGHSSKGETEGHDPGLIVEV